MQRVTRVLMDAGSQVSTKSACRVSWLIIEASVICRQSCRSLIKKGLPKT
jgi:hypothetical protein